MNKNETSNDSSIYEEKKYIKFIKMCTSPPHFPGWKDQTPFTFTVY